MPTILHKPIMLGLAAAFLFMALNLFGISSIFLVLSAVPLLFLGYCDGFVPTAIAAAVASAALLFFGPTSSMFFIASIAVPSFFLIAHHQRGSSALHAIVDISACALIALIAIHIAGIETGGIPGWIERRFDLSLVKNLDPALLEQMKWLSSEGSYLMVGMVVWWTIIFMLVAMWLTEKLLKTTRALSDIQLTPYFSDNALPRWLLWGMISSILIGFYAPENLRFTGLLSFVIILLPYYFVGAMYTPLRKALERSLGWSLVITMIMLVLAWPALVIVSVGVFKHAQKQFR